MKAYKCDFCGKFLVFSQRRNFSLRGKDNVEVLDSSVDICSECMKMFNDLAKEIRKEWDNE